MFLAFCLTFHFLYDKDLSVIISLTDFYLLWEHIYNYTIIIIFICLFHMFLVWDISVHFVTYIHRFWCVIDMLYLKRYILSLYAIFVTIIILFHFLLTKYRLIWKLITTLLLFFHLPTQPSIYSVRCTGPILVINEATAVRPESKLVCY